MRLAAVTIAVAHAATVAAQESEFLPPQNGVYAAYADVIPPWTPTGGLAECLNACLNYTGAQPCIHTNVCNQSDGSLRCGIGSYTRNYTLLPGSCSYYQRLLPRNDTRYVQAVPWVLQVPTGGVTLHSGLLLDAFNTNIEYLLANFPVNDLLYNFRKRAGLPQAPGAQPIGWDQRVNWIEGSLAAMFLMGAGNSLKWTTNDTLRAALDELVDGIANCSEADGWIMAFNQSNLPLDEHPDYTTSWTVHGFLAAHAAGNPKALAMIRGMMNVFNNHTTLPQFLPPDGGNAPWQTPIGAPPQGWVQNVSTGTGGLGPNHIIYLIMQGIIHSTQMALSDAGTQADVDIVTNLYQEEWWLKWLATEDPAAVWQKQWYPHNYMVTAFEAYADMWVLTGNELYLNASMGAWKLMRDNWIHVGGSFAINEGGYYAPQSYWLTANSPTSSRKKDYYRTQRELVDAAMKGEHDDDDESHAHVHEHAKCDGNAHGLRGQTHHHGHRSGHTRGPAGRELQNDWNEHPTGELCGASFWTKLNQRWHRLWPDNETFVAEMERELYSEILAHQGLGGVGIRYFSNLHGQKEEPAAIGTCCEGQGTRQFGSLPEYLYSLSANGVYVDLYAHSSIVFPFGASSVVNVTTVTDFPASGNIEVQVLANATVDMDVALRIPSWTPSPVQVSVDGVAYGAPAAPGSYLHIKQTWSGGVTHTISFNLTLALASHLYKGVTQIAPYSRYGFTVGPFLLALEGPWNASANCITMPTDLDPATPAAWMVANASSTAPLRFSVQGHPELSVLPHFAVNQEQFTAFPCFSSA